jgi:hypothetical protein
MRSVLAALTLFVAMLAADSALAERRLFIIANNADGYGVDRCLASGEKCGSSVATAYCKTQEFASAQSFRKVDRDDITGAIPTSGTGGACHGDKCNNFVAIECTR